MQPEEILVDQLREIMRGSIEAVPQIIIAVIVVIVAVLINKLVHYVVKRALSRTRLRRSLQELISLAVSIVIITTGIMIAAVVMFPGLTPSSILAGLGIGSVAIGFAFKDVFENFLAGIIILFRREMRIGDYIECQDIEGEVRHIAMRESHIRQTDGQLVIVPNSVLFKNPVKIRTNEDFRRVEVICGVSYDTDVDQARDIISQSVTACDSVETEQGPVQVFAQEFGSSSINFEVAWWTGSKPVEIRASRDEVVSAVKRALDDAGIEIPFPYRTLTFKEPLPLQQQTASDG
ncbi:mechanosensitive ion channel family protein [Sulfitobacter sp. HNIBRBA2951]|uniref:mechanosensitive ion channel family protein n=1 Tax=Sulfitobacter aquimarinus TaxID=3158557 RepID=UPI0032DE384A